MSEFKRGDKVVFEKDGKELIGVIHAVGNSLAGVEVGVAYLALAIEKLTIATPARIAGFKVGDKARVLEDAVGFTAGTIVTLYLDDNTSRPLWEGPNHCYRNVYDRVRGRQQGAYLSLEGVEKLPEGPKEGVLWADAPEGATHYSLFELHGEKWHKLEGTTWSYNRGGRWHTYTNASYAYVESQVAIPGVKVVSAPVVVAPAPAPALDFSKWEKGDVVRSTSDDGLDITVGHFYILTEDASRSGWLKFRDDDNYPRTRHIENYELVLKRSK